MSKQVLKSPHTTLLSIPARLQWENHHGYCGETSIQSCLLFYGGYISQIKARQTAGSQVLIGENAAQTIKKLGLSCESWDNEKNKTPQIKDFLQWIKKHISEESPVIVAGYEPEGKNDEYDHIYLAVGFNAEKPTYNDHDYLIYADHFDEDYIVTAFGKIYDTRSMQGNGKHIDFALPKDVCYGIAVTGIIDKEEQFLPVRVLLEENSEPNVSEGEAPVTFKLRVQTNDLTHGKQYALLRYNHYKNLPVDHVYGEKADQVTKFVANGNRYEMEDEVQSDGMVFYRCVELENLE